MNMIKNMIRNIIIRYKEQFRRLILFDRTNILIKVYYYLRNKKGQDLFETINKTYRADIPIIVCPYAGTGDVYLAAACLGGYIRKNNIQDFVFVVIGAANVKIARLFGIKEIIKTNQQEMDHFIRFLSFYGIDNQRILIAHHDPPNVHTGILDMMRNYNSLNFMDIFTYGTFGIATNQLSKPCFAPESAEAQRIIQTYNLRRDKTVLLAPYSYTLVGIPDWVWKRLVIELKARGFDVCTNCGSDKEKEIEGTYRVSLPYSDLEVFLKYAGNFIGIRSGFCDVISSIACKKVIIYQPYMFWGPAGNMDYFSLKIMGLDENAIELEYQGIEFFELIDSVVKAIEIK